jgi:NADPH-dependent 2,4-dienoyl-CoA reductase/sulfur reductase-like enzyme
LRSVLVVGAGLAGLRACETLRQQGFEGSVQLVGSEDHLPYDRPPLSKQVLAGSWEPERCLLKAPGDLEALGIELDLGSRAESLDLGARSVMFNDGRELGFDGLVIATGANARELRGISGRPAVLSLRSLEDALALRAVIARPGAHLVVAGAGLIGLEVAATARGRGAKVTVVDPCAVPLEQAVGPDVGRTCEWMHRGHGVDLRLETKIEGIDTGLHGRSGLRCRLDDGSVVEADALLVAVGVAPATSWLESSGLELSNGGVVCDASLTAAPRVVAAGDLARWPQAQSGELVGVEHRTNAAEQGEHAAKSLLAGDGPRARFAPVPYFWSDQYGHKIQVLGSLQGATETVVVDGSLEELSFVVVFGRSGRFVGALGFGRPRVLMAYMPLLQAGASFAEALALTPA